MFINEFLFSYPIRRFLSRKSYIPQKVTENAHIHDTSQWAYVHQFSALAHVVFSRDRANSCTSYFVLFNFFCARAITHARTMRESAKKWCASLVKSCIVGFGNDGITLKEQIMTMCFWCMASELYFYAKKATTRLQHLWWPLIPCPQITFSC